MEKIRLRYKRPNWVDNYKKQKLQTTAFKPLFQDELEKHLKQLVLLEAFHTRLPQ